MRLLECGTSSVSPRHPLFRQFLALSLRGMTCLQLLALDRITIYLSSTARTPYRRTWTAALAWLDVLHFQSMFSILAVTSSTT